MLGATGRNRRANPMTVHFSQVKRSNLILADHAAKVAWKPVRDRHLLTCSRHSIGTAAFWYIALERCCRQRLMVDATVISPGLVPTEKACFARILFVAGG